MNHWTMKSLFVRLYSTASLLMKAEYKGFTIQIDLYLSKARPGSISSGPEENYTN